MKLGAEKEFPEELCENAAVCMATNRGTDMAFRMYDVVIEDTDQRPEAAVMEATVVSRCRTVRSCTRAAGASDAYTRADAPVACTTEEAGSDDQLALVKDGPQNIM